MAGQAFIHVGVVGGPEFERIAILAQLAFNEQVGFLAEGLPQRLVEIRENLRIGLHIGQAIQL